MSIIKPHIAAMSAYQPPLEGRNPDQNLLLDFNERTLPVGEAVRQALVDYINSGRLQMYPSYGDVVDVIAGYAGVESCQLMITNGSDQGIDLVFRATCSPGDEVIIPSPNFAMYKQCAGIENVKVVEPEYTIDKGFPVEGVLSSITAKTKVICVSNPSNPSGTSIDVESIIRIATAAPDAAILVDECYFEYSKITLADKVADYPNIVITRTFSKTWGIPSLRLGYIIADEGVIKPLLNVRGPYDVNQLAIVAVKAALENREYTLEYIDEVMNQSKPYFERFLEERGIEFWPSSANYVWTFPEGAERVCKGLQERGILVRPKANSQGKLGLRVTLGNMAQTDRLIKEYADLL